MLKLTRRLLPVLAAALVAGCAADGTLDTGVTTSSVNTSQAAADPVCTQLVSHIETLRRDGIADKIEKAANKKYKMTTADLTKADQLNKANAEFQSKCTPKPLQASVQPVTPVAPAPAQ
jgi:hypothetical protein